MGFKDFFKKNEAVQEPVDTPTPIAATTTTQRVEPTEGLLDLHKGDILDLTKTGANLSRLRGAAGWDVKKGSGSYDLDLFALLLDKNDRCQKCVYYGDKHAKGVELDHDNLTGEGEGDDENIFINLEKVKDEIHTIKLCVAIYEARNKGQCFADVKNAYVRLVDESDRDREVCRYNLSNDGGNNTAVICADIYRSGDGWEFKAIGDYCKASIGDMKRKFS